MEFIKNSSDKETILYGIVGGNVKYFRLKLKLSQLQLSTNTGISRISIVNIEKGKQHPSLYLISKIADCLAVNLHDLIPAEIIKPNISSSNTPKNKEVTDISSYKHAISKLEKGS